MGFGKSSYEEPSGKKFKRTSYFKIVEGENHFRILPPMKSLQSQGDGWHKYHSIHWGFFGLPKEDGNNAPSRPFRCVEKKAYDKSEGGFVVIQECPVCEMIAKRVESYDKGLAMLNASPKTTPEEMETYERNHNLWMKRYNVQRKEFLNVKNANGEFGVLRLSYRMVKEMRGKFQKLLADGIDAIDPNQGVWVNIIREGSGFNPPDRLEFVEETVMVDGRKLKDIKRAPLTTLDEQRAEDECADLALCVNSISYDQVGMLVKVGDDGEAVDRILALSRPVSEDDTVEESPAPRAVNPTIVSVSHTAKASPKPTAPTMPNAPIPSSESLTPEQLKALFNR